MKAFLTNTAGKRFPVTGTMIIGRTADCTVRLKGRQVSHQHCSIVRSPGAGDLLVDLNSSEGTELNQARMLTPTLLKAGDAIRVGRHQFKYHDETNGAPLTALAAAAQPAPAQLTATGVIAFSSDGLKILWASEQARVGLPKYFPAEPKKEVQPAITDWLAKIACQIKPEALCCRQEVRQMVLRLVERVEAHCLVVTSEEEVVDAVGIARLLHLSDREGDVLYWLVSGQDRSDIGKALFISKRTVDKHCENLFLKLGVTNRTAAIRLVAALPGFALL